MSVVPSVHVTGINDSRWCTLYPLPPSLCQCSVLHLLKAKATWISGKVETDVGVCENWTGVLQHRRLVAHLQTVLRIQTHYHWNFLFAGGAICIVILWVFV